jgi:hypothetical protein
MKIKTKPQLFIAAQAKNPKLKIIVSGGYIQDIIKESCPNIDVEIFDYDIDGMDIESNSNCFRDEKGEVFQLLKFN